MIESLVTFKYKTFIAWNYFIKCKCFWLGVMRWLEFFTPVTSCSSSQPFEFIKFYLGVLWREWCWSWNSSTLATSCEELTLWKRLWCWEGLRAGGEGDDRGWDGWMASLTRWTWVWVNSRVGDGQGGLACCDSWGCKELDTTEQLNWTNMYVPPLSLISIPLFKKNYLFILIGGWYCSVFCHTLTWISHGCMCVPHPKPLFIFCGICLFAFHRDSFLLFIYSHIFSIK